jgi:hypothetical protein
MTKAPLAIAAAGIPIASAALDSVLPAAASTARAARLTAITTVIETNFAGYATGGNWRVRYISADVAHGGLPVRRQPERRRRHGVIFDFFVSNPDVNNYPLEAVTVPGADGDRSRQGPADLPRHGPARRRRIPGARLASVDRGGHPCWGIGRPLSLALPRSFAGRARHSLAQRWLRGLAASDVVSEHGQAQIQGRLRRAGESARVRAEGRA